MPTFKRDQSLIVLQHDQAAAIVWAATKVTEIWIYHHKRVQESKISRAYHGHRSYKLPNTCSTVFKNACRCGQPLAVTITSVLLQLWPEFITMAATAIAAWCSNSF
jgi:hypothetical protein